MGRRKGESVTSSVGGAGIAEQAPVEPPRPVAPKLAALLDSIDAAVAYISADQKFLYVNQAYAVRYGLNRDDVVGRHIKGVIGRSVYDQIRPEVERALAGETVSYERLIRFDDGAERFLKINYSPDLSETGTINGYVALIVDETDKYLSSQALEASEERYRAFIAQSSEGIWRFELDRPVPIDLPEKEQVEMFYQYGYLAECNDAMAHQYGLESALSLIGARLGDLLIRDDPNNTAFLREFVRSGYRLNDAESHERDLNGYDRYFLNNFVGIVEDGQLKRAWGSQRDITASKAEELARSRLAAIVESSDDAIIGIDLDGTVMTWNAAAERIYGFTAEEAVGRSITQFIPDHEAPNEHALIQRVIAGEMVAHHETTRRARDGSLFDVSLTISPIRDESGNVIGVSKIARDISERRQTERVLNENRLMLAMAMQSSRMGVWENDLSTGTVTWSEELEQIFGIPKGSFGGSEEVFFQLVHEDDREKVWHEIQQAISERRPYSIEFRFYHADGRIRWMEGRGEAVYSSTGEPIRLYGIGLDVTARKETEERLRRGEERFRLALSSGAVTVYEQDTELRYTWLYPRGPYPEDIIGKTDVELEPGPHGRNLMAIKQNVLETGQPTREEISAHVAGEEKWFDLLVEPRRDQTGKIIGVGGTALDVTVRRRVREELRRSEERLQTMFDSTTVGVAVLDTDRRFLQVNDAFCAIAGFDRAELIEMDCAALTYPDDVPEILENIRRLIDGQINSFLLEKRYVRKDRSVVWVQNNVSLTHDADGRPLHLIAISQDVTNRRQIEDALRESEQRFSRFMQQLPGLAWIKDVDGRYVYANDAAIRSFGVPRETLFGKNDDEIFPPETAALFKEHDSLAV